LSSPSTAATESSQSEDDVLDPGGALLADGVLGIDLDLHVQAVADQQHRAQMITLLEIAGELCRVGQAGGLTVGQRRLQRAVDHRVGRDVGVTAL
jgi:hypothetical protein